jgi:hypothetical protein|nr:MAG TPA: hypothetical protein [Caudoviricetes sp.]
MRIYIVAADVQDRDEYVDYTTRPLEKLFFPLTVREDTELQVEDEHVESSLARIMAQTGRPFS